LANCRKHARATEVWLTLSYMNNLVTLNMQDNGVGFDPTHPRTASSQHSGGFGLSSMRRRVEQLGGTLLVESAPGRGTTLMAALPVLEDEESGKRVTKTRGVPSQRSTS
jgi:signal transduction histidine kinase